MGTRKHGDQIAGARNIVSSGSPAFSSCICVCMSRQIPHLDEHGSPFSPVQARPLVAAAPASCRRCTRIFWGTGYIFSHVKVDWLTTRRGSPGYVEVRFCLADDAALGFLQGCCAAAVGVTPATSTDQCLQPRCYDGRPMSAILWRRWPVLLKEQDWEDIVGIAQVNSVCTKYPGSEKAYPYLRWPGPLPSFPHARKTNQPPGFQPAILCPH